MHSARKKYAHFVDINVLDTDFNVTKMFIPQNVTEHFLHQAGKMCTNQTCQMYKNVRSTLDKRVERYMFSISCSFLVLLLFLLWYLFRSISMFGAFAFVPTACMHAMLIRLIPSTSGERLNRKSVVSQSLQDGH